MDIVNHPSLHSIYSMFGVRYDEDELGNPINNERKENYVKCLYNSIGRRELQLRELLLILNIYFYSDTIIDDSLHMLINSDMNSFIIRNENDYYTLEIDFRNKKVKVYDVSGKINCHDDLIRLKNCGEKKFKKIVSFTVENIKIDTNFPEARDILAVVIFMIRNNKKIDNVNVDRIDVVLMSDLIKIYLGELIENQSDRLRSSLYFINLNDPFILGSGYKEIEHNGMNFAEQLRKGYSTNGWTYAKQYKQTYINNCNSIINPFNVKHKLTATEFILSIHYLSNNLSNVIDPTYVYPGKRRIKYHISDSDIYYIPVCDEKLNHWSLWKVNYDHEEKNLDIYIYDSKDFYADEGYDFKNRYRDDVFDHIDYIFGSCNNRNYHIMDTVVKQDEKDSTTCGYFMLFYLAACLNNVNIKDMINIKNFNIKYFIEDLQSGMVNLNDEEKAKLYYNSFTKPKIYKLEFW